MITGLSSQWYELTGKRLEILKEAILRAEPVAVLTGVVSASLMMTLSLRGPSARPAVRNG
jgi:uncharacterized protein YvpB